MSDYCYSLDAYLADDLPAADAVAFRDHLLECDECREAVAEQRWIDGLLQSPLRPQLEPLPHDVLASVQTSLPRNTKQRRRLLTSALAVAAVLAVTVGWTAIKRDVNGNAVHGVAEITAATGNPAVANDQSRASFVSSSNAIVMPLKSRHANVSIVRIYPTYKPRYEAQTAAIEPETTSDNDWNIYSNGG